MTRIYGRSASCRVADPADYTRVPQGLLEEDFDLAYYCVVVKSVIAVENVAAAINQIEQTTLRKGVGQHCLDETVSEADRIHVDIQGILDVQTTDWGEVVTLVDLKNVQLPESMKRAMARQAEAEREGYAEIIATEGESLAADALAAPASHILVAHPGVAAQPAEPGRDRRRQEHPRLPSAADGHHRRTGAFLAWETAAFAALIPTGSE